MKRKGFLGWMGGIGLAVATARPERVVAAVESMPVAATLPPSSIMLTASGGLCTPISPYYELMPLSPGERPIRDALMFKSS